MEIKFVDILPENYTEQPILISGNSSIVHNQKQYLSCSQVDGTLSIYEIRYEHHSSPFKQAMVIGNNIAIGHEEHFYLFNLTENTNIIKLKLSGYFGNFYVNENLLYVTGANDLYCLDQIGIIKWQTKNLGIDGVIINDFTESDIYGNGEWDPPGGWEEFILDIKTGTKK
jgi:outer membrane protein assembly factor BamB